MANDVVVAAIGVAVLSNIVFSWLNGRRNGTKRLHEDHESQNECLQVLRDHTVKQTTLLQQIANSLK